MTDYSVDSPALGRLYCPGCEPTTDPLKEILDVLWCGDHTPERGGEDDAMVLAAAYLSGGAEVGGEDNARWCDLVHGRTRLGAIQP